MVIKNRKELELTVIHHSTSQWLDHLGHSVYQRTYEKKFNIQPHILRCLICKLCEEIIIHTNPHRNTSRKNNIDHSFNDAIHFLFREFINDPDKPEALDINNQKALHFYIRKAQSQYIVANQPFTQFHRIIYIFINLIDSLDTKMKFNFPFKDKFINKFNLNVEHYIKLAFFISNLKDGFYTRKVILNYIQDIAPEYNEAHLLLFLKNLSLDRTKLLEKRAQFAPRQSEFAHHSVPLLKLYPFLHYYDQYENIEASKDFIIAPLPDLIINRIHDLIYYELKDEYGNKFTEWYGDLFEIYCGKIIQKIFSSTKILTEDDIRKTYGTSKKKKVPDYIIVKENAVFLIECKAARIMRGLFESNDPKAFDNAFEHIRNAYEQQCNFAKAVKNKSPGLQQPLHCVDQFYGIIITFEEYAPAVIELKNQIIKRSEKHFDDISFIVLSIDQLEKLEASMNFNHIEESFEYCLSLFNVNKNFQTTFQEMTINTKSVHSFLDPYFSIWVQENFPDPKNI